LAEVKPEAQGRKGGPVGEPQGMTLKRKVLVALAASLALAGMLTAAFGQETFTVVAIRAESVNNSGFAVGVPTIVDPIRAGAEPIIAFDNQGNPMVSAPGGSSVTSSWFWKSQDGGQTYTMMGPSSGHLLCSTGGGDSLLAYDKVNGDMYLTDQQSLVSLATGKLTADGKLTSACFSTPAMSADRPFEAILHPTGTKVAPQFKENGRKPIVYLSWQCNACLGGNPVTGGGGLAFAWSDDGTTWHGADAGVPADTLVTNQFYESPTISSYLWHGTMYADPETGYVFTAISCGGGCPNGSTKNEVGIAVGKPGAGRADPSNIGQFASESYQTVATTVGGEPMPDPTSLFPILTADSAGTLYMVWVQGDGGNVTTDLDATPPATSWHVYYSYSIDKPDHKVWSKPTRVDQGIDSAATVFTWAKAGDPGKLAVTWLATDTREHPSKATATKRWYPYMGVSTNAASAHPTFQQSRVGVNPMHLGDICLQGTICVASNGNRSLADFISIDIAPNGAAAMTWASDANQIATLPTSFTKGVPITFTARQVAGPRLIGGGDLGDVRFSVAPSLGRADRSGDAEVAGANQRGLDLTGSEVDLDGQNVTVKLPVAALSDLTSPDSNKSNVWWLTVWQFHDKLYFAKAESSGGAEPTFTAGEPASYDRPGISLSTVPTLLDYRGGTAVTGSRIGNNWVISVPPALVGDPKKGDQLESVSSFTVLDNGQPPFATVIGNVPTIVDSTPAYNATLGAIAGVTKPVKPRVLGAKQTRGSSTSGKGLAATGVPDGYTVPILLLVAAAASFGWRRRGARVS
jgi:hypothetical protein